MTPHVASRHTCTRVIRSVANPIRRLLYHPLESSDPKVAQALAKRKEGGLRVGLR